MLCTIPCVRRQQAGDSAVDVLQALSASVVGDACDALVTGNALAPLPLIEGDFLPRLTAQLDSAGEALPAPRSPQIRLPLPDLLNSGPINGSPSRWTSSLGGERDFGWVTSHSRLSPLLSTS